MTLEIQHPEADALAQELARTTGQTIMYLGQYYRLQIIEEDQPGVRFQNRFYISRQHQDRAGPLLRDWYMTRAREKLTPKRGSLCQPTLNLI